MNHKLYGYKRENGTVGVRNKILIVALDECMDGIAKNIAAHHPSCVVLTNHYTCMLGGNEETYLQIINIANNPNIYGTLLLTMGCGSIPLKETIEKIEKLTNHKRIKGIDTQSLKGSKNTILEGRKIIEPWIQETEELIREEIEFSDLRIGIKCGGSDFSSGFTSNPAVGSAADKLVDLGAICIAGELFELAGCEEIIKPRFKNKDTYQKFLNVMEKEIKRWEFEGVGMETMSIGNYIGGISTIEEKSLGSLNKTGSKEVEDVLIISREKIEQPHNPGFYLSDATMLCGGSATNFLCLGVQVILWTTGSAAMDCELLPTIKVSGNRQIINDDIDVNACDMLSRKVTKEEVGNRIVEKLVEVVNGSPTNTEGYSSSFLTLFQKDPRVEHMIECGKS